MWDSLSDGIINLLNTMSTVDPTHIFDHGKTNISGYPEIQVTPNGGPAQFADTTRNQRSYVFNIDCYQERTNQGEDDSETIMRQLVDELIAIFDANPYLDGSPGAQRLLGRGFCRPIPSLWSFVQGEQVDLRKASILLECVVIQ